MRFIIASSSRVLFFFFCFLLKVTFCDPEAAQKACVDPAPVIDGRRANCNLAAFGVQRSKPSSPIHGTFRFLSFDTLLLKTLVYVYPWILPFFKRKAGIVCLESHISSKVRYFILLYCLMNSFILIQPTSKAIFLLSSLYDSSAD